MTEIPFRLGLQQRILPSYRAPFFNALGRECQNGLQVFAGQPREEEAVVSQQNLESARLIPAKNHHFFSGSYYMLWQEGLTAWLQSWQPQALILEANLRYLSSQKALRWVKKHHIPVIGWGLGVPASSGWQQSLWRVFLRQFDALIAYSRQGAAQYTAAGFDPQRILVAANAAVARPLTFFNRPLEFKEKPLVLYVGRLQARKKVDLLIKACAGLSTHLQPRLWIVGDGPVRAELQSLAEQIYPQAIFLGAVHGSALTPLFQQADLFVLPGTGGLAVQEAMAHALPVIVAEADGTQSDLVRPENGWIVNPGDLMHLQTTLASALADPLQLRQMGQSSYRIVAEEINLEKMVEAFVQAINLASEFKNKISG